MIDPQKQYRTRDGRSVRIYATDGCGILCVHGAIKQPSGCWQLHRWNELGNPSETFESSRSLSALVEVTLADELRDQIPWEALRPEVRWVAMDENGEWYGYQEKPRLSPPHWDCMALRAFSLNGVVMPSVDSMRWQETLIERPKGV